jgi:NAD+ kinase
MRIALVPHPKKRMAIELAKDLYNYMEGLAREGADVEPVLDSRMEGRIDADISRFWPLERMPADIVLAIGGDGTLLRTLQLIDKPVLGINVGSLGFLMEVHPEDARTAVDRILSGQYKVKERSKIHARIGHEVLPEATNEIVVLSKTPAKIVTYDMYVDMSFVYNIRGDGLIFSTPVGSTCYALSAGGAILDPELRAFEVVALAPFMGNFRPLIVPDTSVITVRIGDRRRPVVIAVDGANLRHVKVNEEIIISRSKRTAKFVRFDLDFYRQLQQILAAPSDSKRKRK